MVMVGVVPSRHSYGLIKETGVFIAILVPSSMRDAWNHLGFHSERDEDKLAKLGPGLGEATKAGTPSLLDIPVSIEGIVIGDAISGFPEMFVGMAGHVHTDACLVGPSGLIDWTRIDFLEL